MEKSKKSILINILVICLYFLWPYFFNSITDLFNISQMTRLYVVYGFNFLFLFVIIYIYKDKLNKYYNKFKKKFKLNLWGSLKIFCFGLLTYVLIITLFDIINVPVLNNQNSMTELFKRIPIMFILNTLFYYPIIEELIFKMSFKDIFKNKWSFVIITGTFNALFQIVFSLGNITDLLYLLPYSIFFSTLSYIYYKTDNIMYPIMFRICYNLIPCIGYIIRLITNGFVI